MSKVTLWAASPQSPEYREPILEIQDPSRFGTWQALAHRAARLVYTVLPGNARRDCVAGELWLVDVGTGERRQLASDVCANGGYNYPVWSPDDRWVVFVREKRLPAEPEAKGAPYTRTIAAIDVDAGQEVNLITTENDSDWTWPLDWSPDGRYFYYLRGIERSELWRVDTAQGNRSEYVRLVSENGVPYCYFVAPDGSGIACSQMVTRDPPLYAAIVVPTDAGEVRTLASGARGPTYNPVWHPSGAEVTVALRSEGGGPAELRSFGIRGRPDRTLLSSHEYRLRALGWSPDAQWLAVAMDREGLGSLAVVHAESGRMVRIPAATGSTFVGWLTADLRTRAQ